MRTTQIRQQLHDYIDSAEDKKLKALYTLLERDIFKNHLLKNEGVDIDAVNLTQEQVLMLQLSDGDIENGKLISQGQIDKKDVELLNGQ